MIKNYIITAVRELSKKKFYSIINMVGLAICLTISTLIILWVQDEKSFDTFHKDYEQIYSVNSILQNNDKEQVWTTSPAPLFKFAQQLPEVKNASRVNLEENATLVDDKKKQTYSDIDLVYVDQNFFSLFNFPLRAGSIENFQQDLTAILITQNLAKKLFGEESPIGKSIRKNNTTFVVRAILQDIPQNSSIQFDAIIPLSFYAKRFTENGGNGEWKTIDEDLGNFYYSNYIQVNKNADPTQVAAKITNYYKKAQKADVTIQYRLAALKDIHLISPEGNQTARRTVQIFSVIAILLLVIGAVNYINLSTARSLERIKTIGIRKVIGASKKQLFFQFVVESVIIFSVALILAISLVLLLIPSYNELAGKSLAFTLSNPEIWIYLTCTLLGTLSLSSIYPAIYLASFQPIQSLKGQSTQQDGTKRLRRSLVIIQFSISIILIICTIVIRNQLSYMRKMDLGYAKDQVFTVPLSDEHIKHADAIISELKQSTSIAAVSLSGFYSIMDYGNATGDISWPNKTTENQAIVGRATIDQNFIPLMGMKFVAGTNFTGLPSDSSSYIINETLAKQMGLKPPYIGAQMSLHEVPGKVIGILKDFNFKSVKEKVGPIVLWTRQFKGTLYIKSNADHIPEAIKTIEKIYKAHPSATPFSYSFIDDQFDKIYKSENRTAFLFNLFAGVAIFISALGLFALSTYSAQIRIKEIGIRKVLGASVFGIVKLLSREFVILVFIAILIASPIAYYLSTNWLQTFAYKINLNVFTFILGSILSLGIALFTISLQAVKAALANPIHSLKDE
ncbi:ABC transporter permease [Sphingobacterium ginsenosidimutans]|uniref:ABC transporter permease n=1 Tax=Sphingobacterium ginsenosidimutans TaxID=687845 RepID=A0ABP8A0Y3_9SPHI